jgi:hypothetical protein
VTGSPTPENVDLAIGELYGLDAAEFVPARNELVRRLRKAGDRDLAGRVAGLRRPSPSAWAVNQLARRHRAELDELLHLGEVLRTAQTRTLAGADAAVLRDAARARREAVARLTEAAMGLLAERGAAPGAHQSDVAATLEAASLDARAAEEASTGRLTSALEPPSGFDVFDAGISATVTEPAPSVADDEPRGSTDTEPTAAEAAALLREAEQAAAEARRVAAQRSEDAGDALALAERRHREVEQAEAKLARLQRVLDEARDRAREADLDAERAQREAASAEAKAAEAARRREDLRADER